MGVGEALGGIGIEETTENCDQLLIDSDVRRKQVFELFTESEFEESSAHSHQLSINWNTHKTGLFRHLFQRVFHNKLLSDFDYGTINKVNENNKKGEGGKRKKLSGSNLSGGPGKAKEYSEFLSKQTMDTENELSPSPHPHGLDDWANELWQDYKDLGADYHLAFAAARHDRRVAKIAIEAGADVNFVPPDFEVPVILVAAEAGAFGVVEQLLECTELNLQFKDEHNRDLSEVLSMNDAPQALIEKTMSIEASQNQAESERKNDPLDPSAPSP